MAADEPKPKLKGAAKRVIRCSICTGPAKTRTLIDKGIVDGVSRRDLEDMTGVHRSSIQRHKDKCLEFELRPQPVVGELVEEGGMSIAVPSPGTVVVRNRRLGEMSGLLDYAYNKVEQFDQDAADAKASGQARVTLDARQKAWDVAWKIGTLAGITKEVATNDNRVVNIFQNLTPDELRAAIKALSPPKEQE